MPKIVNTTPHGLTFQTPEGEILNVPSYPGNLVSAKPVEEVVDIAPEGVVFVRTVFTPSEEGEETLSRLERENPGSLIVGSIIAAQAYPGRVMAMTPCKGFERVPPSEKRMSTVKFTVFGVPKKIEVVQPPPSPPFRTFKELLPPLPPLPPFDK